MKAEVWALPLSVDLTLGIAKEFEVSIIPDHIMFPNCLISNIPQYGMCYITEVTIDAKPVISGKIDCKHLSRDLWLPYKRSFRIMGPKTLVKINGVYIGYIPCGYMSQTSFPLSLLFKGQYNDIIEKAYHDEFGP
jgi:hypothetical protein